jgi:hypothetical protein
MVEFRSPIKTNTGPFSATGVGLPAALAPVGQLPARSLHVPFLARGFGWLRNLLAFLGVVALMGLVPHQMRFHEQAGRFMGEITAAQTAAQTVSQAELQGAVAKAQADAQQFALAYATQAIEAYKAQLQMRIAGVATSLDVTKTLVVDRAKADLDARNKLLEINAQLQADIVKRITEVKVALQQGNIASVQVSQMLINLIEGFGGDASRVRSVESGATAAVLDGVTNLSGRTQPIETSITDPITNGQLANTDVTRSIAQAQGEIQRLLDMPFTPPPMLFPGAIVQTSASVSP